jgi:phosphate transport system substrate-binding protein
MRLRATLKLGAVALAANVVGLSAALALDQSLPAYRAVTGISGQIRTVGSDTLGHEVAQWAEAFKGFYSDVKFEIQASGSATAPPALLEGASQFGPMSRPMAAEEAAAFEQKYGYKVSSFRVAVDALAIYVNKENPIPCLTVQELNRIFSSTRRTSGGGDIKTWGDAGLTGEWAAKPISLYGRNSISGTYEFFRENTLFSGEYKGEVKQQTGSEAVVQGVANDRFAIGYSGVGYKTDGVRTVPLALYPGGTCHDTSAAATLSGKYPIARYLYVYINKNPNQPLDPLRSEFIKYVLSKDGQTQTENGGFYPITNEIRETELKKFGISKILRATLAALAMTASVQAAEITGQRPQLRAASRFSRQAN